MTKKELDSKKMYLLELLEKYRNCFWETKDLPFVDRRVKVVQLELDILNSIIPEEDKYFNIEELESTIIEFKKECLRNGWLTDYHQGKVDAYSNILNLIENMEKNIKNE